MKKPKIALVMIARSSEATLLEKAILSAKDHVDGIFVLLNHRKGEQPDPHGPKVCDNYKVHWDMAEWNDNFGAMRTQNLKMVPKEYDWVLWLDVDDTLELKEGVTLHSIVTNTPRQYGGIMARYNYDYNAQGKLIEVLKLVRLFKNDGAITWDPNITIHETLVDTRSTAKCYSDEFWVEHHTTDQRRDASLVRNIELLEKQLAGEIEFVDPRTLYYLGISHADAGNFGRAKELLETYLTVSGWDEERAEANCWLGRIAMNHNVPAQAKQYYAQALSETPHCIDAYIGLGAAEYALKQYEKAIVWLELSLVLKPSASSITQTPFDNKYRPYMLLAQCNLELGGPKLDIALGWAKKAQQWAEDDASKMMIEQLEYLSGLNNKIQRFAQVAQKLKDTPNTLEALFKKLPDDVKTAPAVLGIMNQIRASKKWPKKSVVIYCGSGPLKGWTPDSLKDGIGGSEEAVIRISKHLKDLGYAVTVFAEPLAKDGVYDGVDYKNYWEISFKDKFDVFISWRSPWVFDYPVQARKKYLWLHDVMENAEFTKERLDNLDKVFLLSEYHREVYPSIPDNKVFLTGNGIDPDEFEALDGKIERNPHRIFYSSSHVRGLEHLYTIWPSVKERVPDAELIVAYGWESFDNVNAGNPERTAWKEKMVKLANELSDVHDIGRIGQDKVVEETFKAGVWAYPCPFQEIYCIAAVKAQAAGAFPVVSNFAALKEMVQFGEKLDMGNFGAEALKRYEDTLVAVLLDEDRQAAEREQMQQWARETKSWLGTAKGWIHEFNQPKTKTDL